MQKNGAFFYMIGSLSNGKFVEKKRFYVNNSAGYEQPQDILLMHLSKSLLSLTKFSFQILQFQKLNLFVLLLPV